MEQSDLAVIGDKAAAHLMMNRSLIIFLGVFLRIRMVYNRTSENRLKYA